uniref:Inhibitor of growth protein n=1 Tax=Rhizochromulina marina TaxID=1034831 RepID=A0A7S2WAV2_9STRA|mmetsp:Transcript_19359/g.56369  ORF Transcript_19359/g.56369 Transcript_19359/m.56369 type:complete len:256 (+) Transcript_19359:206-973(+)
MAPATTATHATTEDALSCEDLARAVSYVSGFFSRLRSVPAELRDRMSIVRALDEEATALATQAEEAEASLRQDMQGGNGDGKTGLPRREERLEAIRGLRNRIAGLHERKALIAAEAYNLIDTHIVDLDHDIAELDKQVQEQEVQSATKRKSMGSPISAGSTGKRSNKKQKRAVVPSVLLDLQEELASPVADLAADLAEPVYCICQRVSFGDMVACDNDDCAREWFHFECVGLEAQPEGRWLCPECQSRELHAPPR